jgi:hypothetical protein
LNTLRVEGYLVVQRETTLYVGNAQTTPLPSGHVLLLHGWANYDSRGKIVCDVKPGDNGTDGVYGGDNQEVKTNGTNGTSGQPGQNGCKLTLIVYGNARLENYGSIDVSGTAGGKGGNGGDGGTGKDDFGGPGFVGYPGGDGGNAGEGAAGGQGGHLKLAVLGDLEDASYQVTFIGGLFANGGAGGAGGKGGNGGKGGAVHIEGDGGYGGNPGQAAQGAAGGNGGLVEVWANNIKSLQVTVKGGPAGKSGDGGNGSYIAWGGDRPQCGYSRPGTQATPGAEAVANAGNGGSIAIHTPGLAKVWLHGQGGVGSTAGTPGVQGLAGAWRFGCPAQTDPTYAGLNGTEGKDGGAGGQVSVRACQVDISGELEGNYGGNGGNGGEGKNNKGGNGGNGGKGGTGGTITVEAHEVVKATNVKIFGGVGGSGGARGQNSSVIPNPDWGAAGFPGAPGADGQLSTPALPDTVCTEPLTFFRVYLPAMVR